jgi:hypothetical protein
VRVRHPVAVRTVVLKRGAGEPAGAQRGDREALVAEPGSWQARRKVHA